jgi:FkbM family methyltransferase
MAVFPELLRSGDLVIEIGAHIGYVSLYLAHLIGPRGRLVVFEPGPNNLPYLRKNTRSYSHITIVDQAVTDRTGSAKLFVENLTGQNNSLLDQYAVLQDNARWAFVKSVDEGVVEVECTTLDAFLVGRAFPTPSLIKIDVEGSELSVLKGMEDTLRRDGVALMVEVTENARDVFGLLEDAGFHLFLPDKNRLNDPAGMSGNIFCLKGDDHRIGVFSSQRGSGELVAGSPPT